MPLCIAPVWHCMSALHKGNALQYSNNRIMRFDYEYQNQEVNFSHNLHFRLY